MTDSGGGGLRRQLEWALAQLSAATERAERAEQELSVRNERLQANGPLIAPSEESEEAPRQPVEPDGVPPEAPTVMYQDTPQGIAERAAWAAMRDAQQAGTLVVPQNPVERLAAMSPEDVLAEIAKAQATPQYGG